MKNIFNYFIAVLLAVATLFTLSVKQINAIYDPLSVPNNKIGIHLLFTDELGKARELVNSTGGDWGYVTIPIQTGDKDLKKWQLFMDEAKRLHLIPIIRLATEGDYFDKSSWKAPTDNDVVDFANFLNSLNWPVKNRYVIVFNEVNRADEWRGQANPARYAQILSYTVTVFKSKNPDYFLIFSGMDNAAETSGGTYNQYDFLTAMNQAIPGIFNQIDGHASHSYPNPNFSQAPSVSTQRSINSFSYEQNLIESLSNKKLPIFITETGWDQKALSETKSAAYFKEAIEGIWNNKNIVAITPFLLNAGPGPFEKFSFIKNNGDKSEVFRVIESLPKTKGKPQLYPTKKVLGINKTDDKAPVKDFSDSNPETKSKQARKILKWIILGI